MSFFEILLGGNSEKERRSKRICAIAIAATAAVAMILLLAFVICQIVGISTQKKPDKDTDIQQEVIDVGETAVIELSDTAIFSGNLLTLNANTRYRGDAEVVNLQERKDRPKNSDGDNSYSVLLAVREKFHATDETATALNKMLKAFYEAKKDDNIFISGAYNKDEIESQDAIYSSGEAIALSYFHDYATNGINDQRSIAGVEIYKWIYNNAHKYGFIAISSSSNIFRYVGVTHATAAKTKGLSFTNYLKQLDNATPETPLSLGADGNYIAYTCPISNVVVPKNYSYEKSGNNVDGVIITVNLSKATNNTNE